MKTLTERHVQAIWYDAALRPQNLATRQGAAVSVVSPGEWNLGAGPDFRNAVLELGDAHRRVTGDVEVHICPGDWDLHAHGTDPNYRNVIAHVTWQDGIAPATLPAKAVSIWLGSFMRSNPAFAPEQIDLGAYPYARLPLEERPCERRFRDHPEEARQILAEAGRHRLKLKARRLMGRLAAPTEREGGRRQIFYSEMMTALGYAKNKLPFRRVAARVPIANLPRENEAARNALLAAGSFETWHSTGQRPNNAPEVRLASAADVFTLTPAMELADVMDFSRANCREMVARLCVGEGGRHCMGAGRAAAIIANVVLPFALAEERVSEIPDWLPVEDVSEPVRQMAYRMFGRDHNPKTFYADNGLLVQGVLAVSRGTCADTYPDCDTCALGTAAA